MGKVHRRTSSVQHIMLSSHYHSNMDPSKLSTMYTCIMLAAEQRKKCGWHCTTIKFDLPLEKTGDMVLVERQLTLLSGVNIRLGGFHYLLSDRNNYGEGAHVFLKIAGGVTRGHAYLCQIRLNLHNPFASLASSVVSERSCELQRCPAVREGSSCSERTTFCRSKCEDGGESAG